jgi:3-hydroxybutyryl-CoA dehydrogenase
MGSGIALAAAQAGLQTILYELNPAVLDTAQSRISASLLGLITKKKITEEQGSAILSRMKFTNEITDCVADIFIEAIIEKLEAKISLFNSLAVHNAASAIFATNTSSLPVTDIAQAVVNPERVIGLHFFNPATIMKLVEVIRTTYTNEQTISTVMNIVAQMGKTAVSCKDSPGFIVNRVARPYYIEALRLIESGNAQPSELDALLEATGFKMGPFKLMDLIGNDINYAVSCSVYEQLGKPERLRPSFIQEEKVAQGKLGRKTGEGYFSYNKE